MLRGDLTDPTDPPGWPRLVTSADKTDTSQLTSEENCTLLLQKHVKVSLKMSSCLLEEVENVLFAGQHFRQRWPL